VLGVGEVFGALEEAPAGVLEDGLIAIAAKLPRLRGAHVVNSLVHLATMWKRSSTWMACPANSAINLMYGFHMFARHELQFLGAHFAEGLEESAEALLCPFATDPQQAAKPLVDLVDDREVLVALPHGDLIDADGFDTVEIAVGEAPVDHPPDSAMNHAPVGSEYLGNLAPREPSCQRAMNSLKALQVRCCRPPRGEARR